MSLPVTSVEPTAAEGGFTFQEYPFPRSQSISRWQTARTLRQWCRHSRSLLSMTRCQPLHVTDAWHKLSTSSPLKIRELTSGGRADTKSPSPPLPPSALSRAAARSPSILAASGRGGVTAAPLCAGGRRRQRSGLGACLLTYPCRPPAAGVLVGRRFRGESPQFRDRGGGAAARLGEATRHGAAARHQAAAAAVALAGLGTTSIPVPAAPAPPR